MVELLIHTPEGNLEVDRPLRSPAQEKHGLIDAIELDNEEEILRPYQVWLNPEILFAERHRYMILRFYKRAKKNGHTILGQPRFTRGGRYLRGPVLLENGRRRNICCTSMGSFYVNK